MPTRFKDPELWFYSVASAFIGGGANAVLAMSIAPEKFNLTSGLDKTFTMWLLSGLVSMAAYLKQSPLPPLVETTIITETSTTKTETTKSKDTTNEEPHII